MPDQITLRKETNLYDDEAIKAVRDSVTSVDNKVTSQYATCSTPSSTAAKVAVVDGTFTLFKNARVSVYFLYANTTSSPTLNVAETGAKPIWAYGGPLSNDGNTFNWAAGATVEFVYDGSHWLVVDSSATKLVSGLDEKLNQEVIFNRLTNDGAIRGLFMQNNQMYINMDYLQTGTIKLGGANNGNGLMVVYNSSGGEIGRWSMDGLIQKKGSIYCYLGTAYTSSFGSVDGHISFSSATGFSVNYNQDPTGKSGYSIIAGSSSMTTEEYGLSNIYNKKLVGNPGANTGNKFYCEESISASQWETAMNLYSASSGSTRYFIFRRSDGLTGFSNDFGFSRTPQYKRVCAFLDPSNYSIYACSSGSSASSGQYSMLKIEGTGARIDIEGLAKIISTSSEPFRVYDNGGNEIYRRYDSNNGMTTAIRVGTVDISSYDSATLRWGSKTFQFVGSSARRYKHDITENISKNLDAHKLYDLHMKQFVYNDDFDHFQYGDMKGKLLPGFIAEDVEEIYPAAVIHNADGNIESWDERRIIPAMLTLIQEQNERIKKLEGEIKIA